MNINLALLKSIVKKWASLVIIIPVGLMCITVILVIVFRLGKAQKNYFSLRKDLKISREAIWNIRNVEIQRLNQEIILTYNRFPAADKLLLVIKEISETAKNDNVKMVSISPGQQTDVEDTDKPLLSGLNRIQINMRLEGPYENLASFLTHLSRLDSGVIKINSFRFDKMSASASNLTAALEANVYVRKTNDQDLFQTALEGELAPAKSQGVSRFQAYLRNPFSEEAIVSKVSQAALSLEGIIYDPAEPIALINGEARRIGDQVGDVKILDIQRNRVLFQRGSEEFELSLGPT